MAFWNRLLGPTCAECGARIRGEPVDYEQRVVCPPCHRSILGTRAQRQAELSAYYASQPSVAQRAAELVAPDGLSLE